MIKSDKKLNRLSATIGRKNILAITEAIRELRNEEPYEGAIELLATLYDNTDDRGLHRIIEEFFNDIKEKSARPEIIAEIRKPWKQDTINMLVSSCWQSGLDYSEFLDDLITVFIRGDYATSVESMTAIAESLSNCSRKRKNELIKMIEDSPLTGTNEKSALSLELISILKE